MDWEKNERRYQHMTQRNEETDNAREGKADEPGGPEEGCVPLKKTNPVRPKKKGE